MDTKDTVKVINALIETSEDGKKGFADAAQHVTKPELKTVFQRRAADCDTAVLELQRLVQSLGSIPKDSGTAAETAHRGWARMKTTLGDPNLAMLEDVERAEDKAKLAYTDALNAPLPRLIRNVVERQYAGAKRNHDLVRDLRNSYRAEQSAAVS
jgi:uncharacterized protein (TIGR02284 family)